MPTSVRNNPQNRHLRRAGVSLPNALKGSSGAWAELGLHWSSPGLLFMGQLIPDGMCQLRWDGNTIHMERFHTEEKMLLLFHSICNEYFQPSGLLHMGSSHSTEEHVVRAPRKLRRPGQQHRASATKLKFLRLCFTGRRHQLRRFGGYRQCLFTQKVSCRLTILTFILLSAAIVLTSPKVVGLGKLSCSCNWPAPTHHRNQKRLRQLFCYVAVLLLLQIKLKKCLIYPQLKADVLRDGFIIFVLLKNHEKCHSDYSKLF